MAGRKDRNGSAGNRAESVPLSELKPHPRNYRSHPEDQIEHVVASLRDVGVYRNVVAARDGTLLAGHGVVEAARRAGLTEIPVVRLDLEPDDPRALKILVGDNYISRLSVDDERELTEMLRRLKDSDGGIDGTGFDEMMLANLVLVTRHDNEIDGIDAAAEWAGADMPEHLAGETRVKITVLFQEEEDVKDFMRAIGATKFTGNYNGVRSVRWPIES